MFISIDTDFVNINHIVRFRYWNGSYHVMLSDDTIIELNKQEYKEVKQQLELALYTIK